MNIEKVSSQNSVANIYSDKKNNQEKSTVDAKKQDDLKLDVSKKEEEEIKKEINTINKLADTYNLKRNLEFSVRDKQIVIKVTDNENNVIREIPPEKILEFRAKFKEVLGLFIDRQL